MIDKVPQNRADAYVQDSRMKERGYLLPRMAGAPT
jgi:hypothetical protein